MAKRKPTNKYYFSVEGETEQWYLKWLQDTINNTEKAACKVSIDCPVRKNPSNKICSNGKYCSTGFVGKCVLHDRVFL